MAQGSKRSIALSVEHVSKNFRLPHEKTNSIKSAIVNVFKSKDTSVEVQRALRDISFDVKDGEFFGILGRNGSGKSTMLKILAEIYKPTTGSVKTHGKLVPFIELGVGFNPELTGRENVYLNGALLGFSRKEIDERYDDIVQFAELEEFMDQKLKNYSSGMQVRLAFSVATRAEADILLVDEVLAVGDADFQRKCYDYFMSLKKQKKTVVFVTHDMGAVREYCDRAILINEGKITHSGPADKVANEYLKLFNRRQESADSEEANENRWGNGAVQLGKVSAEATEEEVILDVPVINKGNDIEGLDIGIDFNDKTGHLIWGTQYLYTHPKGFSLQAGQRRNIRFRFANIFGNREFVATISIRANGGNDVCDFWDQALTFQNSHSVSDYYPIVAVTKSIEEIER